ncbi:unnamed protein product, partial [Mesorhabditis spiculigera]
MPNSANNDNSLGKKQQTAVSERLRAVTDSGIEYIMERDEIDPPHRARLYQLFSLIEKEFDQIYAENCELHAKIALLTEKYGEAAVLASVPNSESAVQGGFEFGASKGSARKAMQMGQKLRTALRGPPGRLVFKVGADGRNFRMTQRFAGHKDGVWHVTANDSAKIVASAGADQTARVFSLDSGHGIATYVGHTGSVNCVSLCPVEQQGDSLLFCSASGDETTHIWRSPTVQVSSEDETTEGADAEDVENHDLTEEPESEQNMEGIKIKSTQLKLTGHKGPVIACEWLAGGQQIITASWDRTANIYDTERGDIINVLTGHEQELNHCSAHNTQKLVVTASKDYTFRLWDFREPIHSVAVFQGHNDSVTSVAFSANDRLVSGSDDRTVKVWDLRNMRCALTTIRLSSAVNRLAISQNHAVIAIPHDNRHVRIYDLNGIRVPRIPNRRCHHRIVSAVAWADDHPTNNLITCGFDRQVIGWKVPIGREAKE